MKLADYLTLSSTTHQAFADGLGVTQQAVSLWAWGKRVPAPELMTKIATLTKGAVQPNDFYTLPGHASASPLALSAPAASSSLLPGGGGCAQTNTGG